MKNLKYMFVHLVFLMSLHSQQVCAAPPVWSQSNSDSVVALGPLIGQAAVLTVKYWEKQNHAVDGGIGYAFDKYFIAYADYLFQFPQALSRENTFFKEVTPYIGAGAQYVFSTSENKIDQGLFQLITNQNGFGAAGFRFPLGAEWGGRTNRVSVFAEFSPGVGVFPEVFKILSGGAGIRVRL